jgi:mono/diheme cytochrome c family protein
MKRIPTLLLFTLLLSSTLVLAQVNNPWEVPEKYLKMENPFKADESSLSIGKSYYDQQCKTCHGETGQGDGLTAKTLDVSPSDLTLDDLDTQKDGELYYKILVGRDEMHAFKDEIEPDDIWHIVNYIRTFYEDE